MQLFWWERMDSNHRSEDATDLQSAPIGHSGTLPYSINGAGGRIRTPDLLITNQLLYQLSYTSIFDPAEHMIADVSRFVNRYFAL